MSRYQLESSNNISLYKSLIRSILLNGIEPRNFPKQAVNKIDLFERKILLKILGPNLT